MRLHEDHFEPVRRYVWRRDPRLADDVAAETFVIAWRRLAEVPDDALPWLIGVARNVRLNHLRSQRRQEAVTVQLRVGRHEAAAEPLPAEIGPDVRSALAALSPLDREVLLLHAWDELGRSEIAAALGCSKANVSVRLHRAKRRFQSALEARDQLRMTTSEGATDGC